MNKIISLKDLFIIYNLPSHFVAILTMDGMFDQVNGSVATLLGYWEENLLGKRFANIIHPEDQPDDMLGFYKDDDKDYTYTALKRTRRSDGSYRFFFWCFTKLAQRPYIYAIAHNCAEGIEESLTIHPEKTAEGPVALPLDKNKIGQDCWEILQEQLNSLRSIAWKQSHLMRSPLTNLKSLMIFLKENAANPEYIQHVENQLEKLDKIIKEMVYETSIIVTPNE